MCHIANFYQQKRTNYTFGISPKHYMKSMIFITPYIHYTFVRMARKSECHYILVTWCHRKSFWNVGNNCGWLWIEQRLIEFYIFLLDRSAPLGSLNNLELSSCSVSNIWINLDVKFFRFSTGGFLAFFGSKVKKN